LSEGNKAALQPRWKLHLSAERQRGDTALQFDRLITEPVGHDTRPVDLTVKTLEQRAGVNADRTLCFATRPICLISVVPYPAAT